MLRSTSIGSKTQNGDINDCWKRVTFYTDFVLIITETLICLAMLSSRHFSNEHGGEEVIYTGDSVENIHTTFRYLTCCWQSTSCCTAIENKRYENLSAEW